MLHQYYNIRTSIYISIKLYHNLFSILLYFYFIFHSLGGQSKCTNCPPGNQCPITTQAVTQICTDGTYSVGSQSLCTSCPAGKACDIFGKIPKNILTLDYIKLGYSNNFQNLFPPYFFCFILCHQQIFFYFCSMLMNCIVILMKIIFSTIVM